MKPSNFSRAALGKSVPPRPPARPPQQTGGARHSFLLRLLLGVGALLILLLVGFVTWAAWDLPDISNPQALFFSESTVLLDRTGEQEMYSFHAEENRRFVPLADISPHLIAAVLAAEDDGFFDHRGFDLGGLLKAACHLASSSVGLGTLGGACPPRGGSTITQQLVKNAFLSPERTIRRKIRELALATKLENEKTKEEILEMYLNVVNFGGNAHGIGVGASRFFDAAPAELTPAQSAILAAVIQRPTHFSPFGENRFSRVIFSKEKLEAEHIKTAAQLVQHPEWSFVRGLLGTEVELAGGATDFLEGRAEWVLRRMLATDALSEEEHEAALEAMQTIAFAQKSGLTAPHFVFFVREFLEEELGLSEDVIERGGLRVVTTIDHDLQTFAEEVVAARAAENAVTHDAENAAVIALSPYTGEIRAMVGSAGFANEETDGKVNIITSRRAPGSSVKPFVYAAAFEAGVLSPGSILLDTETEFSDEWTPKNFDDTFRGPVSVREALGNSVNIPAVKAAILATPQRVYDLMTRLGISFDFDADFYGAAIALGGAEVRPVDLAAAYAALGNGGFRVQPFGVLRVSDRYGNLLHVATEPERERVLEPAVAAAITDILADKSARGPGWNRFLQLAGDRPNAAKTGTADKKVGEGERAEIFPGDAWTAGYTPDAVVVAWAGNADGRPMRPGGGGYTLAAPIFHAVLGAAHADLPLRSFAPLPATDFRRVVISAFSGLLPGPSFPPGLTRSALFFAEHVPTATRDGITFIEVDSASDLLPSTLTPKNARVTKAVLDLQTPQPERFPSWQEGADAFLEDPELVSAMFVRLGLPAELTTLPELPTAVENFRGADQDFGELSFLAPAPGGPVAAGGGAAAFALDAAGEIVRADFFLDEQGTQERLRSYPLGDNRFYVELPGKPQQAGTPLPIRVRAQDIFGRSAQANATFGLAKDSSPPVFAAPEILADGEAIAAAAASVIRGQTVQIFPKVQDSGGGATQRVELLLDDQIIATWLPWAGETGGIAWSAEQAGDFGLQLRAIDGAGNAAVQAVPLVVVEEGGPG